MRRTSILLAAVAALSLALAPGLADARAGGGGSFGSRGSMTWSAPPSTGPRPIGAPMQRSMTPNTPSPGFGYRRAWLSAPASARAPASCPGLMGGLIGAGIGGLLFGHGFFGGGLGFGGFLGFLLQIFLIVLLVRFLFRCSAAAVAGIRRRPEHLRPRRRARAGPDGRWRPAAPAGPPPIQIGPQTTRQFEQLLQGIQAAWSRHDLNALRAHGDAGDAQLLRRAACRAGQPGRAQQVTDVRLLQGDLAQAWAEGREYATVAMRFSMIDVTRDASGRVVDGSPTEHVTATEIWTFVRSPGGQWILSAIQQAR